MSGLRHLPCATTVACAIVSAMQSHERYVEGGSRTTLILLALILGVAAVLARQAYQADRSYRAAAERVVRDYAHVAAGELLGRVQQALEYYGAVPVFAALGQYADRYGTERIPTPAELAAAANQRQRQGLPLVRSVFRFHPASGSCLPAGAAAACRAIAMAGPAMNERDIYYRELPSHDTIVYTQTASAADPHLVSGFVLERNGLKKFIADAYGRAPLLPRVLSVGNDALSIDLTNRHGANLLHSGSPFDPGLGVDETIEPGYGEVLGSGRIRSSIAARAVPKLVVGGLPRSRAPLFLMLFGLTLALCIAAIVQVNKERALARLRSDFVSSVSHELRTPLTQIRMFTETLLLERVRSPAEGRRSLEIVDQEARRLSHLVENMLRMAQSDRGTLRISTEPVDLGRLLHDTAERFAPLARAHDDRIEVDAADGIVVDGDPESLRQVILNLFDNAVKYGPRGQRIAIGLTAHDGLASITVDDEGPGIPLRDRTAVWSRFIRLDRDRAGSKAGAGIGLAVVRELVTLHGGRAWIETGPRGGARFIIEIPRRAVS
jgi:signal transduction histidine kinase